MITGMETVTLWRPTGAHELELVAESGWTRWPPRLPDQPIFYPVLNEDYATRIAREWNVPAGGVGHVTRFEVRKDHLDAHEVHRVGGDTILEYWIPVEDRHLPVTGQPRVSSDRAKKARLAGRSPSRRMK